MDPEAEELYEKIEIQRINLIDKIKGNDKVSLSKKRETDVWNISEVLGHLIQAETLALSYVKKKMNVIQDLPYSGPRSSININILRVILFLPFKYKAPKASVPEKVLTLDELTKKWGDIRSDLKNILIQNGKESRKLLYKHPFAGRMNLIEMMKFFRAHIAHHIKQIQRIEKGVK